jgi:hypothetical protein
MACFHHIQRPSPSPTMDVHNHTRTPTPNTRRCIRHSSIPPSLPPLPAHSQHWLTAKAPVPCVHMPSGQGTRVVSAGSRLGLEGLKPAAGTPPGHLQQHTKHTHIMPAIFKMAVPACVSRTHGIPLARLSGTLCIPHRLHIIPLSIHTRIRIYTVQRGHILLRCTSVLMCVCATVTVMSTVDRCKGSHKEREKFPCQWHALRSVQDSWP